MGNFGSHQDWIDLLSEANKSVYLMGRSQFGWTRSNQIKDIIIKKIKDGVEFRWLIMSENNNYLKMIERRDRQSMLSGKLIKMNEFFEELKNELPVEFHNNLTIKKFTDVSLNNAMIKVDGKLYITQYLCNISSENCPFFVLDKNGVWAKMFLDEFNTIWTHST
jgi:hypothetical protein